MILAERVELVARLEWELAVTPAADPARPALEEALRRHRDELGRHLERTRY